MTLLEYGEEAKEELKSNFNVIKEEASLKILNYDIALELGAKQEEDVDSWLPIVEQFKLEMEK